MVKVETVVGVALSFLPIQTALAAPTDLSNSTSKSPLQNTVNLGKKFLSMPFTVRPSNRMSVREIYNPPDQIKRQGGEYVMTIYLGSNYSENKVVFDTGSSDLWVKDTSLGGSYDPDLSVTSKSLNKDFLEMYGSGSSYGQWVKDNVAFGPDGAEKLWSLQFASVNKTDWDVDGILGVGLTGLEAISSNETYANFPQLMSKQGWISKNAYSLYMEDPNNGTGKVLFGAYDSAKYEGDLVTLPFSGKNNNDEDDVRSMVTLNNVTINGSSYPLDEPVLLDSGTTDTLLPDDIYQEIKALFGNCEQPDDKYISFNFDGVKINVPYDDIARVDDGLCTLQVGSSGGSLNILGQNFLRHAYVLFDLDDKSASLAQTRYTDESNIHIL